MIPNYDEATDTYYGVIGTNNYYASDAYESQYSKTDLDFRADEQKNEFVELIKAFYNDEMSVSEARGEMKNIAENFFYDFKSVKRYTDEMLDIMIGIKDIENADKEQVEIIADEMFEIIADQFFGNGDDGSTYYINPDNDINLILMEQNITVIWKSSTYTYAPLCSLCYRNAGNIDDAQEGIVGAVKCFCLPLEWFVEGENELPKYPMWDVKTNEKVYDPS